MGVTVREKKKGSGIWWVFTANAGRRKSEKIGEYREAQKHAAFLRKQLIADPDAIFAPSLAEYASNWLETYCKPPILAEGTYRKRKGLINNYIIPWFGQHNIRTVSRSVFKDRLAKEYRNGVSATQTEAIAGVLSAMFNHCVDDEIRASNPVYRVTATLNLSKPKQKVIHPFTKEQSEAVLREVKMYPLWLTLFHTGIRPGEAYALEWGDVNFRDGYLVISRTKKDGGGVGPTKTKESRKIEMSDQLSAVLMEERKKHVAAKLKSQSRPDLIFQHRNKMLDERKVRKDLHRACERLKIEQHRVHDTRHTWCSVLLNNGTNPKWVQRRSGHSSLNVLLDTYWEYVSDHNGDNPMEIFNGKGLDVSLSER